MNSIMSTYIYFCHFVVLGTKLRVLSILNLSIVNMLYPKSSISLKNIAQTHFLKLFHFCYLLIFVVLRIEPRSYDC